jgi:hypothetical protein
VKHWWQLGIEETVKQHTGDINGLAAADAGRRLAKWM